MVAGKMSIARSIAGALSEGGVYSTRRCEYGNNNKVYEFEGNIFGE